MAVRAVLATNVVVRGLLRLRRSWCSAVFDALAAGSFEAVVSPYILTELRATLLSARIRSHIPMTENEVDELVESYRAQAERIPGALVVEGKVPADPDDNPIVAAALEGGAGYVVTEDRGLLDAKTVLVSGFEPIEIVTAGHFVRRILAVGS